MKLLALALLVSSTAMAGTSPEFVTMRDGSVCTVPLFGNGGQYSAQNFLGIDYDTCKTPGITLIRNEKLIPPEEYPKCDSHYSALPCYEIITKPKCNVLVISGSAPCDP